MKAKRPWPFVLPPSCFILIKGAGDLATGVAVRLHRAGFPVVMTELPQPRMVRRTVAFAEAVFSGSTEVEGIRADCVPLKSAAKSATSRVIPVVVDPETRALDVLHPLVLIDAILAKRNTGTRIDQAALVIALGPGFTAGMDCHAIVETQRGHTLGRVLWRGTAEPNTGVPGLVGGHSADRVLRAPVPGTVFPNAAIGDTLSAGEVIARVGGEVIMAPFSGILRGLIHPAVAVQAGDKIGDLDPRAEPSHCWTVSDKSLAIGGGTLEAVMQWPAVQAVLGKRRRTKDGR